MSRYEPKGCPTPGACSAEAAYHNGFDAAMGANKDTLDDLRARVSDLEDELRGVIVEMKHIADEARIGRSWARVEMLAENVHAVLRNKLTRE